MAVPTISGQRVTLLADVTTTGAGSAVKVVPPIRSFTGTIDAGSAAGDIEVSNDKVNWISAGSFSLSGAGDSFAVTLQQAYHFVRANVSALTTGPLTVYMTY